MAYIIFILVGLIIGAINGRNHGREELKMIDLLYRDGVINETILIDSREEILAGKGLMFLLTFIGSFLAMTGIYLILNLINL